MILGIDPGLDGALALLSPNGVYQIADMPTHEITVNKKKRRIVDSYSLARWVELYRDAIASAVLEDVGVRPGEGAVGAFKFGRCMGVVEGVIAANAIPLRYVVPAKWKAALGVSGDKTESRRAASQLFPAAVHYWPLKKHDGRAESVLLAVYGRRFV